MNNPAKIQNWFESWFDSPYYHILYKNRDDTEAQKFLRNLLRVINPPSNAKILDLACGKGRHAIFLRKLNYKVVGTDLSKLSISEAKKNEVDGLNFFVADMREPLKNQKFNCIFNLFTSFGYFDNRADNLKVLEAAKQMLIGDGCFVIDFLNVDYIEKNLVSHEVKIIDNIEFKISRKIENGLIIKNIRVIDNKNSYDFQERLQALKIDYFSELLNQAGFYIHKVFGNYEMQEYKPETSERLLLICKRK